MGKLRNILVSIHEITERICNEFNLMGASVRTRELCNLLELKVLEALKTLKELEGRISNREDVENLL